MRTCLINARVVLADELLERASLLIEDGRIAAIEGDVPRAAQVVDLQGALLLPGLIDLHCDSIEKDIEPRPNALFPPAFGVTVADRRCALYGITTMFHSICFAHGEFGVRNVDTAAAILEALHEARPHALIDNRVHCRYEVTDAASNELLLDLLRQRRVDLLSFMDHTPGQGQFKSIQDYQAYLQRSFAMSTEAVVSLLESKQIQRDTADQRMLALAAAAREHHVPLASHDDSSPAQIAYMSELGVRISEFPIDLETARAATARGIATVVGAPNVLRGQSQSGSLRAIEAIRQQVAACLCSDYAPATLLTAVLRLPELAGCSLPQAVRLATSNPAQAAGLHDRGELAVGKRADCIAVQTAGAYPQVAGTWVAGLRVLHTGELGLST